MVTDATVNTMNLSPIILFTSYHSVFLIMRLLSVIGPKRKRPRIFHRQGLIQDNMSFE